LQISPEISVEILFGNFKEIRDFSTKMLASLEELDNTENTVCQGFRLIFSKSKTAKYFGENCLLFIVEK